MVSKFISQIEQSESFSAVNNQPRLQWLLLIVLMIISASIVKYGVDSVLEYRASISNEINLFDRLTRVSQTEFSEQELTVAQLESSELSAAIPTASSQNAAQASALSEIENLLGNLADRERYNLLGSETINVGNKQFWSIRIEIVGQVKSQKMLGFLEPFDAKVIHRRITSMQYSPKAANSINLVVDLLYQQEQSL